MAIRQSRINSLKSFFYEEEYALVKKQQQQQQPQQQTTTAVSTRGALKPAIKVSRTKGYVFKAEFSSFATSGFDILSMDMLSCIHYNPPEESLNSNGTHVPPKVSPASRKNHRGLRFNWNNISEEDNFFGLGSLPRNEPRLYYFTDLQDKAVVLSTSAFGLINLEVAKVLASYAREHASHI